MPAVTFRYRCLQKALAQLLDQQFALGVPRWVATRRQNDHLVPALFHLPVRLQDLTRASPGIFGEDCGRIPPQQPRSLNFKIVPPLLPECSMPRHRGDLRFLRPQIALRAYECRRHPVSPAYDRARKSFRISKAGRLTTGTTRSFASLTATDDASPSLNPGTRITMSSSGGHAICSRF
jgi:hypothetical protein